MVRWKKVVSPFTSFLSKCKEWLHFPDYSNKYLSIYLYLFHTWLGYGASHGTAFTVYLLCCKWRNESRRSNCGLGWAATSCTAPSQYTEYLHSIHYTLYTPPHRQVWPELARQPGPRTALAACNRLPWNRDSITTLSSDYITCYIFPIHMLLKAK